MEYFTTTQLSERYRRDNSTIVNILKSGGIEAVGEGEHNVKLWGENADIYLSKYVVSETATSANKYAKELGVPANEFKVILKSLGIHNFQRVRRSMKVMNAVEQYKKDTATVKTLPLEEMKLLHPLVTDERCFQFNYWPDTEPICFKDLDND